MWKILLTYAVFVVRGARALTIDSQLGTSVEDCFDRVVIGGQLPNSAIYRNLTEVAARECEQLCKQDKQCRSYDYGVGAKGNSSCDLSNLNENELKANQLIVENADYDVFVRRFLCEQPPPRPINSVFNDQGTNSEHRPVYRPDLSDEFKPNGITAYSSNPKPGGYRPDSYRPDYDSNIPIDTSISYGDHRPVDIPYQNRPYRNHTKRPQGYDQLYFYNNYRPTENLRPDPYAPPLHFDDVDNYGPKPDIPFLRPPEYHYIHRPVKKPGKPIIKPLKPVYGYDDRPDPAYANIEPEPSLMYGHGTNTIEQKPSHINKPYGYDYKPSYVHNKPDDSNVKPGFGYNMPEVNRPSHAHDEPNYNYSPPSNYIYLEIYDPPNYYRPVKKPNHYENVYGSGTLTDDVVSSYPGTFEYRPNKPFNINSYGSNHGQVYKPPQGYTENESNLHKPSSIQELSNNDQNYRPYKKPSKKPGYIKPEPEGYESLRPDPLDTNYVEKPSFDNRQPYGTDTNLADKPLFNNRPSYGNNKPISDKPIYDIGASGYGSNKPLYGNDTPYYEENPSSFSDSNYSVHKPYRPGYHDIGYVKPKPFPNAPEPSLNQPIYGSTKPDYGGTSHGTEYNFHKPNLKPPFNPDRPDPEPHYGFKPENDIGYRKPTHNKLSHGFYKPVIPGYGFEKPDNYGYDGNLNYGMKPSNDKKNHNKPNYNISVRPVYEDSYAHIDNARPSGGETVSSGPLTVADYGGQGGHRELVRERFKACFRRVLAGKRAARSHVRRVLPCERLDDCRRECALETRFHCETFNYRLDPSIRNQGLCELMTKPIEAFDLQRDFIEDPNYDFYERDRNSLEPLCLDTLRGPGYLHSGFLSSKPANEIPSYEKRDWRRRGYKRPFRPHDGPYDRPHDRPYDRPHVRPHDRPQDRPYGHRYGGRKRYEDRFYIPYQIGLPRSNDQDTWGRYGGTYGGNKHFYSNEKDYKDTLNYWKPTHYDHDYPVVKHIDVKPSDDFDYRSLGRNNNDLNHYGHDLGTHDLGHQDLGHHDLGHHDFGHHDVGHHDLGHHDLAHHDQDHYSIAHHDIGHDDHKPSHHFDKPIVYGSGYGWKESREGGWSGPQSSEEKTYDQTKPIGNELDNLKGCSAHRRPGMSLGSAAIRRSLFARNVVECESACFTEAEFKCVSYSYRYSTSQGTDNCFLSEHPYKGLDLSTDSNSDVYAMPEQHGCSVNSRPWVESECFWHVRTGFAITGTAVNAALPVSGLGACEAECIRATGFFCRGFSFDFASPPATPNCVLTSSPPTTMTLPTLAISTSATIYTRGNYGRGCEPAKYHGSGDSECYLQYESSARLLPAAVSGRAAVASPVACSVACTGAPFTCLSYSFSTSASPGADNCLLSQVRLFDLQRGVDYEHSTNDWLFAFDVFNAKCSRKTPTLAHPSHPTTGMSAPSAPGYQPELPSHGGPPYLPKPDYPPTALAPHGPYDRPSNRPYDGPFVPSSGPSRPYDGPSGPNRPYDGPSRPYDGPSRPFDGPSGPNRPYDGPNRPYDRPDRPYDGPSGSNRPYDGVPDDGYHKGFDEPALAPWSAYTVTGLPCRANSVCQQNVISGHWACEPEGGEIGSWDYCCAPNHRCGYSEGFHKPWCYVGPNVEQWRPCSDKYYPYHQHAIIHANTHRDQHRPSADRPWSDRPDSHSHLHDHRRPGSYLPDSDRKYWDDLNENGPQAYYDEYGNPLPGYSRVPTIPPHSGSWRPITLAEHDEELDPPVPGGLGVPRYWPVAYLHKEPPPNTTYFKYNDTDTSTTTENLQHVPKARLGDFNRSAIETRDRFQQTQPENKTKDDFVINVDEKTTTVKVDTDNVTEQIVGNLKKNETEDKDDKLDKDGDVKGISGKIDDFGSIEVLDINDAKGEKQSDVKSLEAEERQIEAIGRLLASKRGGGRISLDKRSQKDMEAENINIDKEIFAEFDFGNKFPIARKAQIQRVTKEQTDRDRSLEVSETTYVRPPRVLSTTEDVRKAVVNGKVFYDATIRERELANRKPKSRQLEESKAPTLAANTQSGKKKNIRARNVNPVRRVRRLYRKRYNPEEVRRRLLEREKAMKQGVEHMAKV